MNELSDKAYNTMAIMKRSTPLMHGMESATDGDILEVCEEIVSYLNGQVEIEEVK